MLAFATADNDSLCNPTSTADPLVVLADGASKQADIKYSCPNGVLRSDIYLICNADDIGSNVLRIKCLPGVKEY